MVNRHFKVLILILALTILSGCDNTTKSDISVAPEDGRSEPKYWVIKADIKVEAKSRADAIARVVPMFEALAKSYEMPPIPAEKPPEKPPENKQGVKNEF